MADIFFAFFIDVVVILLSDLDQGETSNKKSTLRALHNSGEG